MVQCRSIQCWSNLSRLKFLVKLVFCKFESTSTFYNKSTKKVSAIEIEEESSKTADKDAPKKEEESSKTADKDAPKKEEEISKTADKDAPKKEEEKKEVSETQGVDEVDPESK